MSWKQQAHCKFVQEVDAEAAIHAVHDIFEDNTTEAVLLIDAEDAFNSINRKAMLHNISVLCSIISRYISNCHNAPTRFFHYWRDRYIIKGTNYTRGFNSNGSLSFRSCTLNT